MAKRKLEYDDSSSPLYNQAVALIKIANELERFNNIQENKS